jgi:hypothetical protein
MRARLLGIPASVLALVVALACLASPAAAQLNTQHVKGTVGLKGGSQPPPHVYLVAPLVYFYNAGEVKDRDGNRVAIDADLNSVAWAGGVMVVTEKKVLGGTYGYQILAPVFANNRIQGTEIDANPGAGISDSAFVPIQLGWHGKRADATVSYTIYAPTGRYTDGADDNTGFGMWGQEIGVGTTVFLNETRTWHAATVLSFGFQSKKEDSETKVGNEMYLEGGVGTDLLKGGLSLGLVYYTATKLTDDRIDGFPSILIRGRNNTFALGPEVQLALAKKGTVYGALKVNWQKEVYARTSTQGSELTILATFFIKPIKIPTQ